MKTKATGYWAFFCNPKKWAIDKFLSTNPKRMTYQINNWQKDLFKIGDKGVMRVSAGEWSDHSFIASGIYAIVEVCGLPHFRDEKSNYWIEVPYDFDERLVVDLKILQNLLRSPIYIEDLKRVSGFDEEIIFKGGYGFYSSYPITKNSFEIISSMIT